MNEQEKPIGYIVTSETRRTEMFDTEEEARVAAACLPRRQMVYVRAVFSSEMR